MEKLVRSFVQDVIEPPTGWSRIERIGAVMLSDHGSRSRCKR